MFLKRLLESVKDIKHAVRKQAKAAEEANKRTIEKTDAPLPVKAEVSFDEQTRLDDNTKQDKNFKVQNSLRRATWATFWGAMFYATMAACQIYETRRATNVTQQVADTAVKQLDVAERPWVKMTISAGGPVTSDQYGLTATINIGTENSGKSPAIFGVIKSEMFLDIGWQEQVIAEKRMKTCGDARHLAVENREEFETFFPSEPTLRRTNVNVPKFVVDALLQKGEAFGTPLVVACVVYRSTFNDDLHETADTSVLIFFDPAMAYGLGGGVPLKFGSTASPDRLRFITQTHAN
jgi:hypothetical protein